MQSSGYTKTSLFGLIGDLKDETKTFIKEEVQLAKTEVTQNISKMGKHAASLVVGGFVAYAGVIIFLAGLGVLLGFALETLGLQPALAYFIGLAIIGLVTGAIGYAFISGSIKCFSEDSLAPEKAIESLKDFKSHGAAEEQFDSEDDADESDSKPRRSVEEVHASVVATENEMGETMDEIRRRLSPRYANERIKARISAHPYRWNFIAMGTGLVSAFMVKRKILHAHGKS